MASIGGFTREGAAEPHTTQLENATDPQVDSGLEGTRTGAGFTTGAGVGSTNAGPHDSNLMNKLDPTVDSDLDGRGSGGVGVGGTNTSTTGGISSSTNAGPHDSNVANKLDPRVDSDLDGRGNREGAVKGGVFGASGSHATPGSGTAQNTAGPHDSDLANKLDPRVDSNLDGSTTIGGNKTHS